MIFIAAGEADFLEKLGLAKKLGLGVEVLHFMSYETLYDKKKIDYIEQKLAGMQTVLHAPFELFSVSEDKIVRRVVLEHCRRVFDICKRLGSKRVVFHTGYISGSKSKRYNDCFSRNAHLFFSGLGVNGIEIAVENVRESLNIMERSVPDNCKICLDVGHANIYSDDPLAEWKKRLGERITHVHLHNNDGKADDHSTEGNMDLVSISKMFKSDISIEAFGKVSKIDELIRNILIQR